MLKHEGRDSLQAQKLILSLLPPSFTWSAARTDRNVISVLSGQVVEAFDKQFQELYLLSRGVSLKSIPMDEEPEPEPVILPSVIPVTPANAVVKKMVNPKYALVKAKSAEQITKSDHASSDQNLTDRQRAEAKGKAIPEERVSERPSEFMDTVPPIHPGLLNLEKANMFDYLPTWVEPDPEPGSEVLGYINIIDPKIKNIQLSQMNRIKVCDISQAKAQHRQMLKQKMQDGKKNQSNQTAPAFPGHQNTVSSSVQIPEAPNLTGHIQQTPNPTRQIQEAPNATEHIQQTPNPTGQIQEAPNIMGHKQKAPSPTGHTQETPNATRYNQDGPNTKGQIQETSNSTSHSQEAPNATGHNQEAPNATGKIQETPNPGPPERAVRKLKTGDAFATLAFSEHLKKPPWAKVHDSPTADNSITPPVPKPRTVHVTHVTSLKSASLEGGAAVAEGTQPQQPETGSSSPKPKESSAKAEDGRSHCKLTRQEAVSQKAAACPMNGVQGGEAEEDEEEAYLTLSDQGSLSGSSPAHSRQHSNASSISDEYFEVRDRFGPLRRTNSDCLPNGGEHSLHEHPGLQRKLSEPHMSRGTFVSPLGSPQPLSTVDSEDASRRRRRNNSVEEIRCVLGRGRSPCALPDGYITCPSNAPQVGLSVVPFYA